MHSGSRLLGVKCMELLGCMSSHMMLLHMPQQGMVSSLHAPSMPTLGVSSVTESALQLRICQPCQQSNPAACIQHPDAACSRASTPVMGRSQSPSRLTMLLHCRRTTC